MRTDPRSAVPDIDAQLEEMLARCGARERATIKKHLALCDAEPDSTHAMLWRRLATKLGTLAPLDFKTAGPQAVLFFVPDGKYRMQVFALEDKCDGLLLVYLPDVLGLAIERELLFNTGHEGEYSIGGARRRILHAHAMASNTPEPPIHVKNMLGWNRKAVKLTLSCADVDNAHVAAAEAMCELAAERWTQSAKT